MKRELIKYQDGELVLDVLVSPGEDTVWLTQKQMASLYEVTSDNIGLHIKNIIKDEELDLSTTEKTSVVQYEGKRKVKRQVFVYNLDMIISVGYRVNSKKGIAFRKWATKIIKNYLLEGYSINQKRLNALQKTIEIQSKMLASSLEIENDDLLKVINEYTKALDLLDDYDHQNINKPKGKTYVYRLTYDECKTIITAMSKEFNSAVFGVERETGKLKGIIDSIYQSAFNEDAYPSVEEKAANLLYFLIKDHPFADGCKRIAASLFITFLAKNNMLKRNNQIVISNSTLVSLSLMIAESNPSEKETMVTLTMNLLNL